MPDEVIESLVGGLPDEADVEVPEEFRVPDDAEDPALDVADGADAAEDEKTKAPEVEDAVADEATPEGDAPPENWQEVVETYEKRLKDTQKWANDVNARLKALEKTPAAAPVAPEDKPLTDDELRELLKSDPDRAVLEVRRQTQREIEAAKDEFRAQEFRAQEARLRSEHDDYAALVDDYFVGRVGNDPVLRQKWLDSGGDPRTAYEMAGKLRQLDEYLENPEAFFAKRSTPAPKPPGKTLAAGATKPPRVSAPPASGHADVLDSVLASIRKG